jgi:hypothetical protein
MSVWVDAQIGVLKYAGFVEGEGLVKGGPVKQGPPKIVTFMLTLQVLFGL